MNTTVITVSALIDAPLEKVWNCWNTPEHVQQWNQASPDWHCPKATNDLRVGGEFHYTMAARDGSMEFDFSGVYTEIEQYRSIAYTMADGRKVSVQFSQEGNQVKLSERFDAENENPIEMQEMGWQAILNAFKHHTESQK